MASDDPGKHWALMHGDGIPQPGEMIAGKYQVEKVLGQGGMGVVVAAWHAVLRQRVAVKFLLPAALKLPEAASRFLREAQSAVAIKSEHVARVLDMGTLENGAPYIIMEYLTGTDLQALVEARGRLPITQTIDYVLQACEAISEAHSLGIVHRDLKPGNLFLTARADGSPLVKVLDFGLSKARPVAASGRPEASLTATTTVVGTPYYMSPEQMRSLKNVDARTDIWALGVILYELLTGRRPFDGESLPAIFGSIAADLPLPLRSLRPEIPAALESAVLHCLEKSPQLRTKSVAEMARAIGPFGSESAGVSVKRITSVLEGVAPEPPPLAIATIAASSSNSTLPMDSWAQTKPLAKRNRVVVTAIAVVAAAALFVVALGGAVIVLRPRDASAPPLDTAIGGPNEVTADEAASAPLPAPSEAPPAVKPAASAIQVASGPSSVAEAPRPSAAPLVRPESSATAKPGAASPKPSAKLQEPSPAVSVPKKDKLDRWD